MMAKNSVNIFKVDTRSWLNLVNEVSYNHKGHTSPDEQVLRRTGFVMIKTET